MMKDLFDDITQLPQERKQTAGHKTLRRQTAVEVLEVHDEWRRAFGVQQLIKVMGIERPLPGKSYHIITGGNVDLIAHLRWLMCHWTRINRVFISAWAISAADILLLKRWADRKALLDIMLIVGDVFPRKYVREWEKLNEMRHSGIISRLTSDTIHSKIMLLEAEDGTHIVIESSANCNMNPRVEQSVVTVSDGLYEFYMNYFNELYAKNLNASVIKEIKDLELYTAVEDEP